MDSLKYNNEGYRDETARQAIRKVETDETRRLKAALKAARAALHEYGFDTVDRIILVDHRSGKIFR